MIENKYYERKIKYLDLLDNGERTGGAGFIKIEVKGMEISFSVTVKGLHSTDTYEREVLLQTGDGELTVGRISLKEGKGEFQHHMVMDYSKFQGIRIALGGTREIYCKWKEEKRTSTVKKNVVQEDGQQDQKTSGSGTEQMEEKQHRSGKSGEIQVIPWDEIKAVEESLERVEKMMSKPAEDSTWKAAEKTRERTVEGESAKERSVEGDVAEKRTVTRLATKRNTTAERTEEKETTAREVTRRRTTVRERMTEERTGEQRRAADNSVRTGGRNLGQEKKPVRLMEDKWQQIWAIYPHIRPFQDEREYLSISPADFVLLPDESYRAANNSFLLHGYYNYDHLILTRLEKRGEISYYIGVPGNYYEREKQVAVMFGFESFECGTEPAQAGDFGYYMMRTQL